MSHESSHAAVSPQICPIAREEDRVQNEESKRRRKTEGLTVDTAESSRSDRATAMPMQIPATPVPPNSYGHRNADMEIPDYRAPRTPMPGHSRTPERPDTERGEDDALIRDPLWDRVTKRRVETPAPTAETHDVRVMSPDEQAGGVAEAAVPRAGGERLAALCLPLELEVCARGGDITVITRSRSHVSIRS